MVPIYNKDGVNVKITAAIGVQSYMFAIIASPQSNIKSAADLKNVEIASSLGNIIEYVTDKMCLTAGLQQADIKKNSVPSMPLRLEMLNQEKIQAAAFSRPLSDAALAGGGKLVCDDSQNSLMTVCILFSTKALNDRPEDIKKFLKAWSSASEKISSDPSKYRALLVSTANIPANLADKIDVPKFDPLRMPKLEEYQPKMEWNLQKGNLSKSVAFEDVLSNGYLP
jgi:NitT/TauT family transport system substrate-binding protein